MVSDKTMPYLQRRPSRPNRPLTRYQVWHSCVEQSDQQLAKKLGWDQTYATRSRSNAARPRIKALDIFADNNRCWLAVGVDARECSGHAEGNNVVREQPVDVMETAEGAVAELVTRAGDQWRLSLGTTESVPVTAEYLLELMLQLRELRSRGIL